MKWRLVWNMALAALVAVALFVPSQRWWAGMILLSAFGGFYVERRQVVLEAEEEDPFEGVTMFVVFCILAFVIGLGWSLFCGLRWWSLGIGALNSVAFFLFSALYFKVAEGQKRAAI